MIPNDIPEEVLIHYLEPERVYHTLEHIYFGLNIIDFILSNTRIKNTGGERIIKQAWWLHDVIYDVHESDNEDQSAEYAMSLGYSDEVGNIIRNTKYPNDSTVLDVYTSIVIDADLAIMGMPWPIYRDYVDRVHEEYKHLSTIDWYKGRRDFLENLLVNQRPLYKTWQGRNTWEILAVANIKREIKICEQRLSESDS